MTLNGHTSAWLQLSHGTVYFYNCGGITGAGGYGYGVDYVHDDLHTWLLTNMAAQLPGFAMQDAPGSRDSGPVGINGHSQYAQDYYNITRVAIQNHAIPAGTYAHIPGGNYRIVMNFHLYVDAQYINPQYQAVPPPAALPVGAAAQPPLVNLAVATNPDQWPTL